MSLKPLRPAPGPILAYIGQLEPAEARILRDEIASLLSSEAGSKLLELLDKAVQDRHVPIGAPPGALEDLNAQRILVSDLLQIMRPTDAYLDVTHGSQRRTASPQRGR
jgi:hypothetical protein